jgi:PAS domain S-box-containing protein
MQAEAEKTMIPRLEGNIPDMEAHLAMLQAGLDLIDQGFTLFDRDLKLVSCNRTFITLLGFPEELMKIGTPFEAFMRYNAERGEYGPGDVEQLVAERVRAAAAFTPHYAERVRPNGRIIAIHGEPLPHCGFVTLYTDITAQREAERVIRERNADLEQRVRERTMELETAYERLRAVNQVNQDIAEALRRSEARVRLITDTIPAMIAYVDRDWVYQFANRGYAEWFGRTKDGMVGQKVIDVLGPELYGELAPRVTRAMAGEAISYEYAMPEQGMHRKGGPRFASSALVPEITSSGEVLGMFVLSSDITEQKKTQATLLQAQKLEAVGQLAGGIAHDLNNMLTVVLGNLAALEERTVQGDAEEFVEPALLATRRCIELIKRLLTFSRQQPLDPSPVDVRALLKSVKSLLHRTLPQSIAMFTSFGDRLPFAMTDAHQFENALLNLALNARDAMPDGGTLTIHCERQTVNQAQARELELRPGDYVRVAVIDSGCGMDEQTLLHACEPFFTTKAIGSGSGLGLSMVYGFARQSGGALRLQSAPGQGSRMALYLPATDSPPADSAGATQAVARLAAQRRLVLLVEDDSEVRRVVRRQLLELGHTVMEAEDGREALAMLAQIDEIDIVISDVMMPGGVDGPALAAGIHAQRPEIKILLISGHDQGRGASGDYQLLRKPFTKPELAAALAGLTT